MSTGNPEGANASGQPGNAIEEVRQERRVQHYVAWNISDDRFVERAIARAHDRLAVAEHVPRQAETRRKVVVIRIINSIQLPLGDNPGGTQGGEIRLDGGVAGLR